MKTSARKSWLAYLLLGAVCISVSLLAGWSSFARRVNLNIYDLFFRLRGPAAVSSLAGTNEIVIVAIDDATLARYGALPLNRSLLAHTIGRIFDASPQLLGIDILLVDAAAETDDAALEEALLQGANADRRVVLASALEAGSGTQWLTPLTRFAAHAAATGHVHADPDGDGVSRQVLLSKHSGRQRLWAFALECLRARSRFRPGEFPVITETPAELEVPPAEPGGEFLHIPAPDVQQRTLWINYAGPDGTFPRVSLAKLLDDPAAATALRDKIVLLGVTAQGAGDRMFTPFFSVSGMPGIEIHANILHTLLSGQFLAPVSDTSVALAMLLIAALALAAMARTQGVAQWTALLILGALVLFLPYALFLAGQIWPPFSLLLCLGASMVLGEAYQLIVVRRRYLDSEEKRRLARQQFEMATHEMRTPLAAIQASSELLTRYALSGERRAQMLRLLHDESQRLARLVERFLSVERLSAGEMELRRTPVAIASFLLSLSERIRPLAERKGLAFRVAPASDEMIIEADAELLEFAVSNLLTNAVKYSPAGCWVLLEWRRGNSKVGGGVEIVIADNGPGIAPPDQQRLFDRFFRTRQAERSTTPGFGLGLAIAREIVAHHGGEVLVESEPGAGTRFTIRLPMAAAGHPASGE